MYIAVTTNIEINTLAKLAKEIWEEHYPKVIGYEMTNYLVATYQSAEAIEKDMEKGTKYFLIAGESGYVGYFAYRIEENKVYLSKLYVKKSFRRESYGKKTINFIVKIAMINKKHSIYLNVNANNPNSIAFYESCGLKRINTVQIDFGQGNFCTDHVYEMEI